MNGPGGSPSTGRPGAAGCLLAAAALVAATMAVVLFLAFLDSGADRGRIQLLPLGAYPEGSITHVAEEGFFLVRLDGVLLALVDLDAPNQTSNGRRCRVRVVRSGESSTSAAVVQVHRSRFSPAARGATAVLTEDCNGAVYDVAGVRLDQDGPNLDRLRVTVDERGRVVVDRQARTCTRRTEEELAAPRHCGLP